MFIRKLSLGLGMISLGLAVACGGGGSAILVPPPPLIGNFTNASLSGQYAYQITGFDTIAGFREAGVFTSDGNGNITSGTDDFAQGSTILTDTSSGTYALSNDGTGTLSLNFTNGGFIDFAITMVNSSKLYLVVTDAVNLQSPTIVATGAGLAEQQSASAFVAPTGTYVFRLHTNSSTQGATAAVGSFTSSGGVISAGIEDMNRGGVQSSLGLTGGFLNAPDASGRGSGTITDQNSVTTSFTYYVVDANNLRFFSADSGVLGLGRAEMQTAMSYSNADLLGGYAFGSNGDTLVNTGGTRAVGYFHAVGDGNIDAGATDSVVDGTSSANVALTGTYTMAANGRAGVTVNASTQEVFWMVSPTRGFFLLADPNRIEDGSFDAQSSSAFSNASMNGQFALVMDGFTLAGDTFDRIGTLGWDGAGNLTLNEVINFDGTPSFAGPLTGTYSVSANGRTTGTINTLSNNLVFYLVSGSNAYVLQNDASTEIDGTISKQP